MEEVTRFDVVDLDIPLGKADIPFHNPFYM